MRAGKMTFVLAGLLAAFPAFPSEIDDLKKVIAVQQAKIRELDSISGAVLAFAKTSCPSGWKAADGTNGTPDLRGMFLRGVNDFGTGARSDGYEDPKNRTINDTQTDTFKNHSHTMNAAGSHSHTEQLAGDHSHTLDAAGGHVHNLPIDSGAPLAGSYGIARTPGRSQVHVTQHQTDSSGNHAHGVSRNGTHTHIIDTSGEHSHTINPAGDRETAPKNVGVLYCIKI